MIGKILNLLWLFLCHWAIFHGCKRPNSEQIILPSGHSGVYTRFDSLKTLRHFTNWKLFSAISCLESNKRRYFVNNKKEI